MNDFFATYLLQKKADLVPKLTEIVVKLITDLGKTTVHWDATTSAAVCVSNSPIFYNKPGSLRVIEWLIYILEGLG